MDTTTISKIPHIPKVSIGMPVYNGDRFIKQAIESLLNQSFKDFELIISDNASSDDTMIICKQFAKIDDRIKYIRQDINMGPVSNFEYVLNCSSGDYFFWAAHDDFWDKDFIRETLYLLEQDSEAFIGFCRFKEGDWTEKYAGDYNKLFKLQPSKTKNNTLHYSLYKYLKFGPKIGALNLIYGLMRRKELQSLNVLNRFRYFSYGSESFFVNEILTIAYLLRCGNVVFSNQCLWTKRSRAENMINIVSDSPIKLPKNIFQFDIYGIFNTAKVYFKMGVYMYLTLGYRENLKPIPLFHRIRWSLWFFYCCMIDLFKIYIKAIICRIKKT